MYAILMLNFCRRQLAAAKRKLEFSDSLGQALLSSVRKEEEQSRLRVIRCSARDVSLAMEKAMEAKRGLQEAEKLATSWREESQKEYRERCLKILKVKFNYIEYTPCRRWRVAFRARPAAR